MKFIFLTVTYVPQKKSASFMMQALAEELTKRSHEIYIITFSDSISKPFTNEVLNGVNVVRLKVPSDNNNRIKRALIEWTYSWRVIKFLKSTTTSDFGGVIFYSPSIFFGTAIKYIKQRWSIKSYLIIRDIFPDWAVKIGILRKGLIYRFFKYYEKQMILNSDFIGVESKADLNHCKSLSYKDTSVDQLYNWMGHQEEVEFKEHDAILPGAINMIYGGVLGVAQDFNSFLEDIENCDTNLSKLRLIVIGQGESEELLKDFIKGSDLDILFLPPMDKGEYMNIVNQVDVGLIVLNQKLNANNYPGKSFDYMSCSKPIFAYLNHQNEFGELIEKLDLGYYASREQKNLDQELKLLMSNDELRIKKGSNSLKVLKEFFSVQRAADQILSKFI